MLLELKNVCKSFETPSGKDPLVVLDHLSFSVDKGETVSIVGPSGSGKSTLLNIIGTLDQATSGEVLLNGQNLLDYDQKETAEMRNQEIGFIFQLHHLLPQCSVIENVLIPTLAKRVKKDNGGLMNRARLLLEKTGLRDRSDYFPAQLSGGELQRVAVVRALINQPKLILADEPTGSLDHKSAVNLAELLKNVDEDICLIMVTHSQEIARLMGKTYVLQDGHLVLESM